MLVAQVNVTGGAFCTVNVELVVTGGSHVLVIVHITVLVPPQAFGGLPPLLLIEALHPPDHVALFNHWVY